MSDYWQKRTLVLVSIVFFFVYFFLYVWPSPLNLTPVVFEGKQEPAFLVLNQPDEAVNYFFIRRFVINNTIGYPEQLAETSNNQVHPRSTTVIHGSLAPIGFPGMIFIYGIIIKLVSIFVGIKWFNVLAVSVTPLIAVVVPLLFYGFLKKIFTEKISFFSALLLYALPPWWYYASRPFQNNTFFCLALIFFLYVYLQWLTKENNHRVVWSFVLGLSWVIPVYIRGSEFLMIAVLGGALFLLQWKKWNKKSIIFFCLGVLLAIVFYLFTQYLYYGNVFGTGYARPEIGGGAGTVLSLKSSIPQISNLVLPFGFHPYSIAKNFYHYIFILFYPWPLLFFGGLLFIIFLFIFSQNKVYDKHAGPVHLEDIFLSRTHAWVYIGFFIFLLSYLSIFYGSWNFFDNLAGAISIGSSQVRYFMPIYIFALPFAIVFAYEIWRLGRMGKIIVPLTIVALLVSSWRMVYLPFEGLQAVKSHVSEYYGWREEIIKQTESGSVIVTRYADKYLFPQRKIIAGIEGETERKAVLNLLKDGQLVYWYDMKMDEKTLDSTSSTLFLSGIGLSEPVSTWSNLELRKILPR